MASSIKESAGATGGSPPVNGKLHQTHRTTQKKWVSPNKIRAERSEQESDRVTEQTMVVVLFSLVRDGCFISHSTKYPDRFLLSRFIESMNNTFSCLSCFSWFKYIQFTAAGGTGGLPPVKIYNQPHTVF
ncbi:hypothetical protein [uncultured Gimesia sp.]|uniref:hypothetical protein n=1 Tax=uncultured Gimesia sp. TaxID=1678688 RepID=UPI00262A0112|nr:hypothetical protein [uncultured Gimesia sp.]